ncbi:NAD/NADP octopine/nopaline dehydrogenase family protein [Enterococcus sp. AD013-P3]|uniref:NAD/NADP octopine/nopaline dehydrogenase family protein n=1 Tax=Enterococcus sp. AD013-P3 TaxID=3411036 RepID=UPI003B957A92
MRIGIIGFGNIGSTLAADLSSRNHEVSVYSSANLGHGVNYQLTDMDSGYTINSEIYLITDDFKLAVSDRELIFVTYPSFMLHELSQWLIKNLDNKTSVCVVPGTGGAEYLMKDLIDNGHELYGLGRVPYIARIAERNRKTLYSRKSSITAAPISGGDSTQFINCLSNLLKMEVIELGNYLAIALTPSNAILHTSRLYSLFKNYQVGAYYSSVPLFYEQWDNDSSNWLITLDKEVEELVYHLPKELDMSDFKTIRKHYESWTSNEITAKISSIDSFKGILTPMIKKDEGFIPNFKSRYFTEDFPYGLLLLKAFSLIVGTDTPGMNRVLSWYQDNMQKHYLTKDGMPGKDFLAADVPQAHGIQNMTDLLQYYRENQ